MSPGDTTSTAIGLQRYFTKEGVHPYDEIEWGKRDARITNFMDGSIAFEQTDIEFPKSWSLNASNIVAQKYFYGTPGTDQRETSLKHLIDRVADTITEHGKKEGYFVNGEADVFNHELKHILVTQKAAFNSPVWFNIGAPDRKQQASACFILHVEDTMDSILKWYTDEGQIFKGGSGAGTNLSHIRSSYERLGGSGGTASGPVSFMRGADASAGTIKSGGKTRRAAKMVILDVQHPDVEEFIWCKAIEERKARALSDAGFDMDLDGKDSFSIQYQNANNSVRATDEFMQAVVDDKDYELKATTTGETVKTVRARDLMHQIADAAWQCADPGMQFDTTINKWHTASNTDRIYGSNPCSEYMHLDNSACNLASLNLLKFMHNGQFDVEAFRRAVEVIFTAQEILVGYSSYPTEKITQNAKAYRQLGMGYANLGAMLMALGLPYDSDEGRAWAGAITALMTGHGYATSARIARRMGPFEGFAINREPMLNVLAMHRREVSKIDAALVPEELLSAAQAAWDEANEGGRSYGVRNSQATVLAPTGTIGFMMDCDTTGIEPDLSLVKMKKLVGGGTMSIVNQTIPRALKNLGYGEKEAEEIIAHIDEHRSIIGAPHIREEHIPVFATSMGDNTIHYNGHIKMMAAAQPFLSGAISKTVNMPEDVSVDDVMDIYIESWKLGLKAVAIYRENCKVAQVYESHKKGKEKEPIAEEAKAPAETKQFVVKAPMRQEMPIRRRSTTYKFQVSDCKGFFTVGEYEDGRLGEMFINVSKQGSTLGGMMDAFAVSISHGLQWGVPLKDYVRTYINTKFAPSGITNDVELQTASSLVDYIFRRIGRDFLSLDDQLELGLRTADEVSAAQTSLLGDMTVETEPEKKVEAKTNEKPEEVEEKTRSEYGDQPEAAVTDPAPNAGKANDKLVEDSDAPMCYACGVKMQRAGACHVCPSCGSSSGCG